MSYLTYVEEALIQVYENGIAKKILQHMDFIRNSSDLQQARRWGMELIQNARDVAYEGKQVSIKITHSDQELLFQHNGKPFRVKDLLSLINQISSKQSTDTSTVGKFGTGFLSTYQLSDRVILQTVLQDKNLQNPEKLLPAVPIEITLDRSGRTEPEILHGVHEAMKKLMEADHLSPLNSLNPDDFNTTFRYAITSDFSRKAMKYGIQDLKNTALCILLFSERIGSIQFLDQYGNSVFYERSHKEALGNGIWCQNFQVTTIQEGEKFQLQESLHYIQQDGICLAAQWSPGQGYMAYGEDIPRVFVDLPLIGSEQFPFPMYLNCRALHPNEPRSGITLVDNEISADAQENKQIMVLATELYCHFLTEAVRRGEKNISNLLCIPKFRTKPELSQIWVEHHIYEPLFNFINSVPMIPAGGENKALQDNSLYLIAGDSPEEKAEVRQLLDSLEGFCYPTDGQDWLKALENYPMDTEKILDLSCILKDPCLFLQHHKNRDENTPVLIWLQALYAAAMSNPIYALQIKGGELAIFPNQQDAPFQMLYTVRDLKRDPGIPDILKDVGEILQRLDDSTSAAGCLRKKLLHPDFHQAADAGMVLYSKSDLKIFIADRCNRFFRVTNFSLYQAQYLNIWHRAWKLMLSCGPDPEIYQIYRALTDIPPYHPLEEDWESAMWTSTYSSICRELMTGIAQAGTFTELVRLLNLHQEEAFNWYAQSLNLFSRYTSFDLQTKAVFLNQKGQFYQIRLMYHDNILDETLKNIAHMLMPDDPDYQIRELLLDCRIQIGTEYTKSMTRRMVAERIERAVNHIMRAGSLALQPMEIQKACSLLLEWIRSHREEARQLFPDYCEEDRMMVLLTPDMAAHLQNKADSLDQLLQECHAENVEQLKAIIQQEKSENQAAISLFGDAYGNYSDEQLAALQQKIGKAGEQFVYEALQQTFISEDWQTASKSATETVFTKDELRATIFYPDGDGVNHQSGWDIMVKSSDRNEPDYWEVKTHTTTSKQCNEINLSAIQLGQAIISREHYRVVLADYDPESEKASIREVLTDIPQLLSKGIIKSRKAITLYY